jgi:hypothetical protein
MLLLPTDYQLQGLLWVPVADVAMRALLLAAVKGRCHIGWGSPASSRL